MEVRIHKGNNLSSFDMLVQLIYWCITRVCLCIYRLKQSPEKWKKIRQNMKLNLRNMLNC